MMKTHVFQSGPAFITQHKGQSETKRVSAYNAGCSSERDSRNKIKFTDWYTLIPKAVLQLLWRSDLDTGLGMISLH